MFIAIIVTLLSVYPAFSAENESSVTVINTVGIGNIHIKINQFDIVNGERKAIASNPTVLPGQSLNRICEISNLANEAWVRVKIVYAEDTPDVGEDFITLSSPAWKKQGEYYYYTESLDKNETVEFFNKINIPKYWNEKYAKKTISFTVFADAVQKQNFTPDFNSQDPWFGTVIENSIKTTSVIPSEKSNKQFQVIYENGAEGLVKVGDDFFSNWGQLMPGDIVKDKVLIKNNYSLPTTIYFRTNKVDDSELLKKIKLRIFTDKEELYNGSMLGNITDEMELVTLNKGEQLVVFYELEVPSELTNEFSLATTKTEWVFRAYTENMEPPSPDATSNINPGSPHNGNDDSAINNGSNSGSPIQTGDIPVIISIAIAAIVCMIAIYVIAIKGGRRNEKE